MAPPNSPAAADRNSIFWAAGGLILGAALVLRLTHIGALEPFVDEGANILTSLDDGVRRAFDPVGQGRPLLAWMFRPAELLPFSTLTNARVLVALTGTFTAAMLGLGLLLCAGRRAALIGMALWAALPIAVFHERLALQDPLVAALLATVFALIAAGSSTEHPRRRAAAAAAAGLLIGAACLVKISAVLALPWLALAFVAVHRRFDRPVFDRRLWLVAVFAVVPFLLLGADFLRFGSRLTQLSILPTVEARAGNLARFGAMVRDATGHAPHFFSWYAGYGGAALGLLIAAASIALLTTGSLGRSLAAGWVLTALGATLIYHLPYSRYLVPDHVPLVLFIAISLGTLATRVHRIAAAAIVTIALGAWLRTDLRIVRAPGTAPIPADDIEQYVTGEWSGNGVRRLVAFLNAYGMQHQQPCLVFTHAYFRPGCYGLMLAARHDPNLAVMPLSLTVPTDLPPINAVIARATTIFGLAPAVFILDEDFNPGAANVLHAAGTDATTALEFVRADGTSRFALLHYQPKT